MTRSLVVCAEFDRAPSRERPDLSALQPLWLEQSVDEVDHQSGRHETGERIVENHGCLLRGGRRRRRNRSTKRKGRGRAKGERRRALCAPFMCAVCGGATLQLGGGE